MRTSWVFSGTGRPSRWTVPTISSIGDLISAPRLAGARTWADSRIERLSGFISSPLRDGAAGPVTPPASRLTDTTSRHNFPTIHRALPHSPPPVATHPPTL